MRGKFMVLPPADQDSSEEQCLMDIILKLHVKYVGNKKILINKTMSDTSTEFGTSHCVIMLSMHGIDRAVSITV